MRVLTAITYQVYRLWPQTTRHGPVTTGQKRINCEESWSLNLKLLSISSAIQKYRQCIDHKVIQDAKQTAMFTILRQTQRVVWILKPAIQRPKL
jgi:hypothetical protein